DDKHAPFVRRAVVAARGGTVDLGAIEAGAGATADGVVADADGAPVRGASIAVDEFWANDARTETDAEGRFHLDRLPSGAARVVVRADGFAAASATLEPGAAATIRLVRGVEVKRRLLL